MTATSALSGTGLNLAYDGKPVVHDATVSLRPGRVTALVGPNGSGKSTLLRALARLHRPSSGELMVAGAPVAPLSSRDFARRVTLLSQSRPTPAGVQVRDVVAYGRYPYRSRWTGSDPSGSEAVDRAMAVTGVADKADRAVDELSGGELQRVWLATCLAQETGVLLLDEPTTYLDLRYQVEVLDLIRDLADDHAIAVGVVLHDLHQAATVADEVVLLSDGRIRASGPPAEVFTAEALTNTYGIRIDIDIDPHRGSVVPRPIGRHSTRVPGLV